MIGTLIIMMVKVEYSEYADDYVLMSHSRDKEGQEHADSLVYLSSSQWKVDVSHQEAMDWEVPFAPIF
jgi:hypothetical protein